MGSGFEGELTGDEVALGGRNARRGRLVGFPIGVTKI